MILLAYSVAVIAGVTFYVQRKPRTDTPVAWMLWSSAWAARWASIPPAITGRAWFAVATLFLGQVLMVGAGIAFRLDGMPK